MATIQNKIIHPIYSSTRIWMTERLITSFPESTDIYISTSTSKLYIQYFGLIYLGTNFWVN